MMRRSNPPLTRAQFERRLQLLREALRGGRLHFASGLSHSIDGIRRVRFLPNHRIDLLTVDEMTRLNANMMAEFGNPQSFPPRGTDGDNQPSGAGSNDATDEGEGEDEDEDEDEET